MNLADGVTFRCFIKSARVIEIAPTMCLRDVFHEILDISRSISCDQCSLVFRIETYRTSVGVLTAPLQILVSMA
jgi:hypothetical protein